MKHKTRTKALSWLLSLALVLSLLPGMSLTARADGHDHSSWTEWSTTDSLPTTAGNYYLTKDVTISSTWSVPGTTNLCLNGHGIRYSGSGNGSVITVGETATLNLYDYDTTTKHYITLTDGRGTAVSDTSSAGDIEVTGGYITGGNCSNNDSSNSDSGVKVVEGGTFTMYGGTIIGNKAKNRGGGVNNYGTFTMNGGSIENNTAGSGGGVNISSGTFTMSGGRITGNTADYGGGVWNGGTFTMSGGSITGNTANNNGGGVNNGGTFTMSGGRITGNTANYGGGVNNFGPFTMSGGTISGSPALCNDGRTLYIGGGDSKAVLVATNTDGTGAALTYNAAEVNTYGYIAVVPTYRAATVDATTHAVSFTDETCTDYTTVTTGTTAWSNGWYVVSSDVTVSTRITVTGTVNLILCDGATLTASEGITVANDNSLTIYGQSSGTGALIARCDYVYAAIGGDSTCIEEPDFHYLSNKAGTIVINGGKVTATDTDNGAGIGNYSSAESAGTLIVNGGTVTATGREKGAGIGGGENSAGMAVTINGGTVTATGGNYGAGIGGGKNGNGGSFVIYGGTVTATGGQYAGAGIGGGSYGDDITGSTVAIHGGQVTASSKQSSFVAGIDCRKTSLNVSGGTVTATGEYYSGIDASSGTITVSGGSVKATGGGSDSECMGIVGPISLNGMYLYGSDTTENPEDDLSNYVPLTEGDYARTRYMTANNVTPHNHTLTNYTATGATITAECNVDGCLLPVVDGKHIATLTIAPKDDGTATLTGGADFGVTDAAIEYYSGGTKLAGTPGAEGFYTAKITVDTNKTAEVTYGRACIAYAGGLTNGTVSGSTDATVGATITPTITPDAGYEIETLTVTKTGTDEAVTVTGNASFVMPEAKVTVSATFRAINYAVTVNSTTNGAVTASKTSGVHVEDVITLTVTPADGYAVGEITVQDADDHDVSVTNRTFTMPASDVTVSVTFAELTTYTIFYRASGEPASVRCRLSGSGDGVAMAPSAKLGDIDCWAIQVEAREGVAQLPVAFKVDEGSWSALTEQGVVTDIPGSLAEGGAAVIRGEANAFAVAFVWGDVTEDEGHPGCYVSTDNKTSYFLVTNNTASVSVADPTRAGYTFQGWDDGKSASLKQSSTGAVAISGITESTIYSARWTLDTAKVAYNLNGGSGSAPDATVNYGGKATAPANPTRNGYAFDRWVVAESATEKVGNEEVRLSAGTAFDFNNTWIINDLKLKAEWKHVHSYVCLPLNHAAFGNAFSEYVKAGYGDYMHIRICTSMDDYCAEAHSFGSNGKCACGAAKPTPTVTLKKQIGNETATEMQVKLNSVVAVTAPAKQGAGTFSNWQYYDGAKWRALSTSTVAAFVIPSDLQVKAVYEGSKAELNIESFKYNNNIAFYFSYKVPDGYTVLDGGILFGNNSHLRYMLAKTPKESMDLSISGAVQYFAPIPSAVEAPVYYEVAKGNAVNKFGAANVATKMFREEALNVSGRSNPIFKKVSSLGKAGTAAIAINTSADNIFYYGMGYVICRAPSGQLVAFKTNAIAATRGDPNHSAQAVINVN